MRKVLLSIGLMGALLSVAGLSNAAETAPKTLAQIHGAAWPTSNGFAVKDQCMKCHGDYSKLAQKTAHLEPNPHHSHLGAVNCTEYHKPNLSKPELMCNSCHKFTIREKTK